MRGLHCGGGGVRTAATYLRWQRDRPALVSLIGGKSKARVAVLQALAELLNKGITPCLPLGDVDQPALAVLADALQGGGAASLAGSGALLPLAQALHAADLAAPGLSAAERAAVEDGQCASGGTAAICVQAGRAVLATAGAVAALSAEALQADVSVDREHAVLMVTCTIPTRFCRVPRLSARPPAPPLRRLCPPCSISQLATQQTARQGVRRGRGGVLPPQGLPGGGLLEGSRQVNAKKGGAGALPAIADVPAVHGAAVDALAAAAAPVRAVLATSALPAARDGAPQQAGSPALCSALLAAAPALLRAARLSLERCAAVVERITGISGPAFDGAADAAVQQRGLSGVLNLSRAAFEAAQQRVAAVAGRAALADGPPPSLAAAEAAYGALRVLQQAVQAEALAAVVSLRLQEGPAAAAPPPAAEPANGGAPADAKKMKKEKRGGGGGMALGKGTSLLRAALEHTAAASVCAAAGAGGAAAGGQLEACLLSLSLQGGASVALQLQAAGQAIAAHLDPAGAALGQTLVVLAALAEANAARRKPKIAKGAALGGPGRRDQHQALPHRQGLLPRPAPDAAAGGAARLGGAPRGGRLRRQGGPRAGDGDGHRRGRPSRRPPAAHSTPPTNHWCYSTPPPRKPHLHPTTHRLTRS
jgi:hypothetical protein